MLGTEGRVAETEIDGFRVANLWIVRNSCCGHFHRNTLGELGAII